jgi:hypothetical protein
MPAEEKVTGSVNDPLSVSVIHFSVVDNDPFKEAVI